MGRGYAGALERGLSPPRNNTILWKSEENSLEGQGNICGSRMAVEENSLDEQENIWESRMAVEETGRLLKDKEGYS